MGCLLAPGWVFQCAVDLDQYRICVPSRLFWPLKPFYLSFAFCSGQMMSTFYEGSSPDSLGTASRVCCAR
jgi:hypothetical protein